MKPQGVVKDRTKCMSETLKIFNIHADSSEAMFDRYVTTLREASTTMMQVTKKFTDENVDATITLKSFIVDASSKKSCIVKLLNGESVIRSSKVLKTATVIKRKTHVTGKRSIQFQVRRKEE